jgi:hypothetical protein
MKCDALGFREQARSGHNSVGASSLAKNPERRGESGCPVIVDILRKQARAYRGQWGG